MATSVGLGTDGSGGVCAAPHALQGEEGTSSAELLRGLSTMLTPSFPRHSRAGKEMQMERFLSDPGSDEDEDVDVRGDIDSKVTELEDGLRQLRLSMVPPFLDWAPSGLCSPVLSTVDVINLSPDEDVTIHSIIADETNFFYGSDESFEPVTIEVPPPTQTSPSC